MKTPLKHVRGKESLQGDPTRAAELAEWFRVDEEEEDEAIAGLHRLHPYPGRMHPLWARRILQSLPPDASVLDPFCGGGTVLVESRLAGIYSRGSDLNPIAVRLARLRTAPPPNRDRLIAEADRCAANCVERRETRFADLAKGEDAFPKHVLAGLISLRDEIEKTRDDQVKELLLFCLSPMLDKLAARKDRPAPRVPRTFVRDFFRDRVDQWIAAFELLDGQPFAEAEHSDARWLPWKPASSNVVISSPPYPGVFDYMGEQSRRLRWMGVPPHFIKHARKKEMGRRFSGPYWAQDMRVALWQLCRSTRVGTPMFLVVGDGVMQTTPIYVDDALKDLCGVLPLKFVAAASQDRPHFHQASAVHFKHKPRREHLIRLERTAGDLRPLPRTGTAAPTQKKQRKKPYTKRRSSSTKRAKRSK